MSTPLTRADLAWLDGLALDVRGGMGERPGERRFPGRPEASGIELEAYAAYAPGDDLRHLDWNAYARLDTLLVRRFTAEREVRFHLLLDLSASMAVPPAKLAAARALAGALAYVALAAGDALRVVLLPGGAPAAVSPVFRHRGRAAEVAALLAVVAARGELALGAALAEHARRHPEPGAALVVSDLMGDPREIEAGVRALRERRHDVVLLQVLAPEELEPAFDHGVLEDAETGATHPIALTPAVRARYRELVGAHLAALATLAAHAHARHARLVAGTSLRAFVTGDLARVGLVRRR